MRVANILRATEFNMASFTLIQNNDTVTLTTAEIELSFSREDGGLRGLRRVGGLNMLGHGNPYPSLDVQVGADSTWIAERVFVRYLQHSVEERDGGVDLVIVVGIDSLMLYDRYHITGALLTRRVSVVNVSDDALQLHRVRLALPWACVGHPETCRFDAPGNRLRPRVPLIAAATTQRELWHHQLLSPETRAEFTFEPAPTYAAGLLALHNPQIHEALLCWYHSDVEPAQPSVQSNGRALTLMHDLELANWLREGVALSGGTQYILLLDALWPAALDAFRHTLITVEGYQPEQHTVWADEIAVCELHPAELGGFAGVAAQMAWLQSLGITTLCLLPIWSFRNRTDHAWDGNWHDTGDPYIINDFETLDPTLGGEDALRALVDAAHAYGMRVLIDLPAFGLSLASRHVIDHPDWFCRNAAGDFACLPGRDELACFDWSNTELQEHFIGQALRQAQMYDIDGYRIVPERVVVPNWERQLATHASGGAMSVLRMAERLRHALQSWKAHAGIVTLMSGPGGVAVGDMCVDELAHQHFLAMALRHMTTIEMGMWLADTLAIQITQCPRICFAESHQTYLRTPLADGLRGSPLGHVLLASLVLCGYVPLFRSEQVRDEEHFVRQLLHARTYISALRCGRAWYNRVVSTSPDVFVVLRQAAEQVLVGVLNVGPHRRAVTLTVPVDMLQLQEAAYMLYEALSDSQWHEADQCAWTPEQLSALTLTLEPFGTYFFVMQPVQEQSEFQPPSVGHNGAAGEHTSVPVPAHSDVV